jgi:hypothetical protein
MKTLKWIKPKLDWLALRVKPAKAKELTPAECPR